MSFALGQGMRQEGFRELYDTVRRLDSGGAGNFGIDYEFRKALRKMGEGVAAKAPGFVPHKYGRAGSEPLETSVRVSVTRSGVSVSSRSAYGGVQNVGGGPKAGWNARGPHVQRGNASKWMLKAKAANQPTVDAELAATVDWIVREIEAG